MKNILAVFLLLFTSALCARELTGVVMGVENGYSFTLLCPDNQQYKIRLYGMYGPNEGQAFYKEAKDYLSLLIQDQDVKIITDQKDRYGRMVGRVYCNGQYVNLEMVITGNAWWDNTDADEDKELQLAEQEAAIKRIGIWLYHKMPLEKDEIIDKPKTTLDKPAEIAEKDNSITQNNNNDMQLMSSDGKVDIEKTFKELKKTYKSLEE